MTTALLTSCDKPQSSITVLSNDRSSVVAAQPACAMVGTCQLAANRETRIKARGGSQILVDVPKELADAGWIVAAYTTDGTKNTAVTTSGAASGTIHNQHTVRLNVPDSTVGSYYLQVTALRPSNQLTTWLVGVQLVQ